MSSQQNYFSQECFDECFDEQYPESRCCDGDYLCIYCLIKDRCPDEEYEQRGQHEQHEQREQTKCCNRKFCMSDEHYDPDN